MNPNVNKLIYLWQETGRSYRQGGWMNWAAVSTLTLMLFLLGISYLIRLELTYLLNGIGSVLELTAYLKPDVEPQAVQSQVMAWGGIEAIRIEPKEGAWQQLLTDLGQLAPETNTLLGQNPFLDSLKITTTDQSLVPSLAEQLSLLPTVDSVWYGQDLIVQLQQLSHALDHFSVATIVVLTTIALVVTYTTIRLVTASRSVEMEIMGLVGASRRWIYSPILLQGAGFGALAALIAGLLLQGSSILVSRLSIAWELPLVQVDLGLFPPLFALFGIGVATIGTWFSLQEHHKLP